MLQRCAEQAGPDGLLFPTVKGGQMNLSLFNNRCSKKAVAATNLPGKLRVYDLRHTAASWVIREEDSVLAVQRMLGHSTSIETLNTCAHLFNDELDQVTNSISKMLKRHKKKEEAACSVRSSEEACGVIFFGRFLDGQAATRDYMW